MGNFFKVCLFCSCNEKAYFGYRLWLHNGHSIEIRLFVVFIFVKRYRKESTKLKWWTYDVTKLRSRHLVH